ncbi:MobA/MobL family protein [Rhodanobacter sp. Si-c]|uniref:MobA/MobL family protein n=1 Tax=Rhodanobacter lycopersici TaxID=3162487 RepID=A0ABV3QEM2_9GAMM
MAMFHYRIKSGKKGTAVDRFNYITRQGNHSDRDEVVWTEFGNLPAWCEDNPKRYWQTADRHERANGAVYREHVVALPSELDASQQHALVDKLVQNLAGNKPYQYAIHAPNSSLASAVHPHMHLQVSDRLPDGIERAPAQEFMRYNAKDPSQGGRRKDSGGRTPLQVRDELIATRKMIADLQNEALAEHGHATRVDHRSHWERGIKREPERHLGQERISQMSTEDKAKYTADRKRRTECCKHHPPTHAAVRAAAGP